VTNLSMLASFANTIFRGISRPRRIPYLVRRSSEYA